MKVLIVEDSQSDAKRIALELNRALGPIDFERVDSPVTMRAALERAAWDVVICDWSMPQFNALAALEMLKTSLLDLPFIIVSGVIGEESAVAAMRAGAHDYVIKDRLGRLPLAVERELREFEVRRTHARDKAALAKSEATRLALLEEQNRQMHEASRLKSEFLANMSHELRTPLNAIIGFAELMWDAQVGPVSPDQKEYLGDILTSGKHLLRIISDVLDLGTAESGKLEFHPELVDLAITIAEVRDILRGLATERRIEVESFVDPTLGGVMLDATKLKQVLYNYLSNALKFTPESGHVTIRALHSGDDSFRVDVEDSGIGIRPEDIGRLFVAFQQLDGGSSKRYGGTGLGLALTKRIVEAQGGSVSVRSTPDRGSTFSAVLPRSMTAAARTPDAAQEPPPGR